MNDNVCALDVAQKSVAKPGAEMRAFNQAGNIGKDEVLIVKHHRSQIRLQRREGIIGDLGLGVAHDRKQGRFPGIRKTDKRHVGEQFKFKRQPAFAAGLALFRHARRLIGRGLEARVSASAASTGRRNHLLLVANQIGDQSAGFGVAHDCAWRHADDKRLGIGAGLVARTAFAASFGFEMDPLAKVVKRIEVGVGFHDHIAAASAAATRWSAASHIFLAAKRHHAVATLAARYKYLDFINQHIRIATPATTKLNRARIHEIDGGV